MGRKSKKKDVNMEKRNVAGDIEVKTRLTTVTYTMLFAGLSIYIITYLPNKDILNTHPALDAVMEAFRNIALTLLSAGLISALVEVSTITSVVQKALERLVQGNFPFDKFSTDRLTELSKQIAVERSERDKFKIEQLEKTIYCLEPRLLNESIGVYYEYHKDTTIIQPDESKHVFQKWVNVEYKLINRFKEPYSIQFCISLVNNSEKVTDEDIRRCFKIEKLEILCSSEVEPNEKKLKNKVVEKDLDNLVQIESITKKPHTTYNYRVKIDYPIENVATCLVKITCSYEIPMSDPIQSFKLNHPCKDFEHNIIVQKDSWEIVADAYTAFYFTDDSKEYQVRQNVPNSVSIAFKDWALTGAGYMALLFENKNHDKVI